MNDLVFAADDTPAEGGSFLAYLPAIAWQRRWWIVVPLVLGILAAVAAALLIPPRYQASAVMLVQSSQLPDEIIGELTADVGRGKQSSPKPIRAGVTGRRGDARRGSERARITEPD